MYTLPKLSAIFLLLALIAHQTGDVRGIFFSGINGITGVNTAIGFSTSTAAALGGFSVLAAAGLAAVGLLALFATSGGKDDSYGYGHHSGGYRQHNSGYGHHDVGHGHHDAGYGHHDAGHGHHDAGYGHHDAGHHGGHHDSGHHGHQTHEHSSYAHHRRSTRSVKNTPKKFSKMFSMVGQMDSLGCGLKLVCELHSQEDFKLSKTERSIKNLLGNQKYVTDSRDPRYAYVTAAVLGKRGYNCDNIFSQCPLSEKQMKVFLNSFHL